MRNLPEAKTFYLKYRKTNGQIHSYRISNPIEQNDEKFTTYAFGHGVRSFIIDRVVALEER